MSERGGCGKEFGCHHVEIQKNATDTPDYEKVVHVCGEYGFCPACAEAYRREHEAVKEWFHQIETDVSDVYAAAIKELEVHSALRAIEHRKGDG